MSLHPEVGGVEVIVVEGRGHLVQNERQKKVVTEHVLRFLESPWRYA
jgi:esterase/lipase